MRIINEKQKWEGYFTYLDGYEGLEEFKDVNFTMEIDVKNDVFTGVSTDNESKDYFEKPAEVKGFMDHEKMNFILKYPYAYYKNEDGTILIDKDSKHPDIHYLGFFNSDGDTVTGNWEMIINTRKLGNEYIEEVLSGTFQMQKTKK